MTSAEYVFGIDGGGSGCRVAVCDRAGKEIGRVAGKPANVFTAPDAALQNVLTAIADAKARYLADTVTLADCVAHIGLAGVMDKADAARVAAAMPFARVTVTDDRATSVAGALGISDGALISVGTGSFVAAQRDGRQRFVGGWGHVLGDQASGVWLGLQALRRAILAEDGVVPQSDLTRELIAQYGGTAITLLSFVRQAEPHDFATLAPGIIAAAQQDDLHGKALMQEGADYLTACLETLDFAESDTLCLTGGIGPHYADYLSPQLRAYIRPPGGTALDGAVHLAYDLLSPTQKATDTP
ncbi:BadF/BadG/BcrA/BcrD ATPase family protein [Yoonia sp.]|uniref:BadF/BadG/BcrA/BcrD ATPase family protein n=1 Tax=Yoonia sp. TaxID=2212373 RepID=UPI00359002B4